MNNSELQETIQNESISDMKIIVRNAKQNPQISQIQCYKIMTKNYKIKLLTSFIILSILFTVMQAFKYVLKANQIEKDKYVHILNILQFKIDQYMKWNKLPLQLPIINLKNQRIQDYLYPDLQTKKARIKFYQQRAKFIDERKKINESALNTLHLAKHNLIIDAEAAKLAQKDFDIEWERIENKFNLSNIPKELPFCIVSPGYNNNAKFRIELSLNSIFTQNYTNYKAVIINDASTDGSGEIYRKYFQFYQIDQTRYIYIENMERKSSMQNIYRATLNHCSKDSIVMTLDADDQIVGRNALKVFNWVYTTKKSGVVYSNYYFYQPDANKAKLGFTKEYPDNEKKNNLYRNVSMKFSQLRSFRAELLPKIPIEYFKDENSNFFTITADLALYIPLMELSCGRVNKIDGQVHYLYNFGTGLNDAWERNNQIKVEKEIRAMKKLSCDKEFNNRMKSLQ